MLGVQNPIVLSFCRSGAIKLSPIHWLICETLAKVSVEVWYFVFVFGCSIRANLHVYTSGINPVKFLLRA